MILQVRLTPLKGSEDLVAKELCFKLFSTKTFNRTDGPQTIQVDGWVQKTRIEPSTIDFILRLKKRNKIKETTKSISWEVVHSKKTLNF